MRCGLLLLLAGFVRLDLICQVCFWLDLSSDSDLSEALVFSRICPAGPDLLGPAFGAGFVQRRHAEPDGGKCSERLYASPQRCGIKPK